MESYTAAPRFSKKWKKLIIAAVAVLALVVVALSSFSIVPTGYTGVRTTFGQISTKTVPQGFNVKIPFVQSINLVNNKQQDAMISDQIWGETTERTPVYAADVIVTYQINSERSSWIYANVSESDKNLVNVNLVSSAIKAAMVELSVDEVTNRSKIEPLAKEKVTASLNEKYGEGTIAVLKVVINDMNFEESYNNAIAAKSIAQQTYEKQKIENDTAIAKAEAEKKVAITNAEAQAEATLIAERAKAEAVSIAAAAELSANTLLAPSLTDSVLRAKFYDHWDGVLPRVMGNESAIVDVVPEG